jgi:hypothetical protein
VQERSKGLIVLLTAAAITGVLLEVQRHQEMGAASAAASASAPPAPIPAPRARSRAEIEATLVRLQGLVRAGASDERSPWALAHGLVAFGPELRASDGRLAVDVIGELAERGSDGLYRFPAHKDGKLVEPHRHLLVKTLLEVGVPPDRELVAADGTELTLARLASDLRRSATLPSSDSDWRQSAWLLSALVLDERTPRPKASSGISSASLAEAALARLEVDQQAAARSSLETAKREKIGICAHACGGLHFVQAVIASVAAKGEPAQLRRLARQLGALAFRYEAERDASARLLAEHPEQGLLVRVQQLKLAGHLLEALMLARTSGAYRPENEGGRKLDAIAREAAAGVADVVSELDRGGVYARLPQIRAEREQTYLDLVGDGCHAIRGLREVLVLYPK